MRKVRDLKEVLVQVNPIVSFPVLFAVHLYRMFSVAEYFSFACVTHELSKMCCYRVPLL